ncbi:MAG TPA: hypothetical protein VGB63_13865 [Pedobacter sp.]
MAVVNAVRKQVYSSDIGLRKEKPDVLFTSSLPRAYTSWTFGWSELVTSAPARRSQDKVYFGVNKGKCLAILEPVVLLHVRFQTLQYFFGITNCEQQEQLADKELLKQFREVELLSPEDKHLVKTFIDAFLTKRHIQELAK